MSNDDTMNWWASVQVTAYLAPYDYWHDRYQAYYLEGLRRFLGRTGHRLRVVSPTAWPGILGILRRVRHSCRLARTLGRAAPWFNVGLDRLANRLGAERLPPSGLFHPLVGQYHLRGEDQREYRVCIDAQDSGALASPELAARSDLYFKTNYWEAQHYPANVVPLINGNPLLLGQLNRLRSLRRQQPEYDLCFIVRVWGGRDEEEGIEHNLRLLEAVARVRCRKFLLAYLVAGDIPACARRLERQGIPWTRKALPLPTLWSIAARARLNILRLGMHHCVPWRMADLLALGACPVLDQAPCTRWPEPLVQDRHYLNLAAATSPAQPLAAAEQYALIPERIGYFLANRPLQQEIRTAAADYFDRHLEPEAVGRCIGTQLTNRLAHRGTAVEATPRWTSEVQPCSR